MERTGPVEFAGAGVYPLDGIYNVPFEYDFICKYANSIVMWVANASRLPHRMGVVWYGEKGWIHVDRYKQFIHVMVRLVASG